MSSDPLTKVAELYYPQDLEEDTKADSKKYLDGNFPRLSLNYNTDSNSTEDNFLENKSLPYVKFPQLNQSSSDINNIEELIGLNPDLEQIGRHYTPTDMIDPYLLGEIIVPNLFTSIPRRPFRFSEIDAIIIRNDIENPDPSRIDIYQPLNQMIHFQFLFKYDYNYIFSWKNDLETQNLYLNLTYKIKADMKEIFDLWDEIFHFINGIITNLLKSEKDIDQFFEKFQLNVIPYESNLF